MENGTNPVPLVPVIKRHSSATIGKLALALSKAQGAFKPLPRKTTVEVEMRSGGSYSYKYADLADTIESARGPLAANELAVTQTFSPEVPPTIWTSLIHSSGEWIESGLSLPIDNEMQMKDMAGAITYFRRYAYCAILSISAEEDDESKLPRRSRPNERQAAKPQEKKEPPKEQPKGKGAHKDPDTMWQFTNKTTKKPTIGIVAGPRFTPEFLTKLGAKEYQGFWYINDTAENLAILVETKNVGQ